MTTHLITGHEILCKKRKILHGDISPWNIIIEKLTRRGLLIDYDYAIDLDESRQTSKPYPSTPDIWPRKQEDETYAADDEVEHEGNQTLTAEDLQLQKEILEAYKKKVEKIVKLHGQRTVCLDLSISI